MRNDAHIGVGSGADFDADVTTAAIAAAQTGGCDPLRLEAGEYSPPAREALEHQGYRLRQFLPLEQQGTVGHAVDL